MIAVLGKNKLEQAIAYFILFYAGLVFCLPVPHSEEVAALYPWWAKRIDFANILLNEAIFIVWAMVFGPAYIIKSILNRGNPARASAIAILTLSAWCGIISIGAPLVLQDLGRTFRLFLIVCLMLAIVKWSMAWRAGILTSYLAGILVGTLINLTISFMYPLVVYEVMRLSGQNTPGVAMGIGIHLCAWLFYSNESSKIRLFSITATAVLAFSCALSYSRIGWFAGATGILAWCFILFLSKTYKNASQIKSYRAPARKFALGIFLSIFLFSFTQKAQDGFEYLGALVEQKTSQQGESNVARWGYLMGAIEIVGDNPLGVGYSGFFDAQTSTEVYKQGRAIEEDDPASANPHASILWYLIAGGIPAGVLSIYAFFALLRCLYFGLKRDMSETGKILFWLISPSFALISITVPYIFNSLIMIAPVSIVSAWGWQRRREEMLLEH